MVREVVLGRDISLKLCEILGVNPSDVIDLKLDLEKFNVATVEITRALTRDETNALIQVVEQYDFVKRVTSDVNRQPDA